MKRIIAFIAAAIVLTAALSACGNDKDAATPDSAPKESAAEKTAETTRVLETTADGGTLEEDAEGNVIEVGRDGEIVSVKDKNGDTVEVREYIFAHDIVTSSGVNTGEAKEDTEKAASSAEGKDDSSSKAESAPGSGSSEESPASREEETEKIEVELDEYELPII